MRALLIIFFLWVSQFVFAQQVTGVVQDSDGNHLSLVNVQLLHQNTNKIIAYTQSDKSGAFTFQSDNIDFPVRLKASHLSYETAELIVDKPQKLLVVLEPKANELKEIVIEAKAYDVIKRGDTLGYNLATLLDGTELKLKDVVDKLPGLSIDDDGKIRYGGMVIDHLLFDGNEFFDKNHQIANENITAEMIQKIELLTNYQNLSSIKEFENSGKVALNIGVKDEYKQQFKGNFDADAGVKSRYNVHSNLYNFGKKTMFSLVANINNTNYAVLSVEDYLSARKMSGKNLLKDYTFQGGRSVSNWDLPSFLFATDDVATRKSKNYTLNIAHKFNDNERIEFISTFNVLNQTEQTVNNQLFFENPSNNNIRIDDTEGKSRYANNLLKYEKKLKNNAYFKINAFSLWSLDKENQTILADFFDDTPSLNFANQTTLKTNNLGINTSYKGKLSSHLLLEAFAFYDTNKTEGPKNFHSSTAFPWLDNEETAINQNSIFKSKSYGLLGKLTYKFALAKLKFYAYTGRNKEQFSNYIDDVSSFQLDDDYTADEQILGLQYQGQFFQSKLNYNLGLQFNHTNHTVYENSSNNIAAFLPSASVSYHITTGLTSFASYTASLKDFSVYEFLTGKVVDDYRSYQTPSFLSPNKMVSDSYSFGFIRMLPEQNLFSSLTLSYNKSRKNLQKTYQNAAFFTEQQYQYLDGNSTASINLSISKKSRNIPYGAKLDFFGSSSEMQTILNTTQSTNTNQNFSVKLDVQSYYKNSPINFNTGISYMNNNGQNKTSLSTSKSKLERITPFATLKGLAFKEKLNWSVEANYYMFNSTSVQSQNIFDLGGRLQYQYNNNLQVYLHAQNVFNINDHNTKNNLTITPNYTQEVLMRTLSGFINIGASFTF